MTKGSNKSKTIDQDGSPLVRIKFSDPEKEKQQKQQVKKEVASKQQLVAKPTETILVKNVPDSHMDRFDFKSLFDVFGTVTQFTTFVDEEGVNSGAIKFEHVQSAINTVKALNNKKLGKFDKSKPLVMSYQQTKQFPGAPPKTKKNKQQKNVNTTAATTTTSEKQIKANRAMMQQMEQMGFTKVKAEAALIAVENSSVEDAIEWSCSNFPETVPMQKLNNNNNNNETAAAASAAGVGDDKTKKKNKKQKQKSSSSSSSPRAATTTTTDNVHQEHATTTTAASTTVLDHNIQQEEEHLVPSSSTIDAQEEQKLKVSQLVSKMKFQVSQDDYTRFRKLSADFQKGVIGAPEYYKKFYTMFKNDEEAIFFLLLETMPKRDMHKIESLILARHAFHNNQQNQPGNAADTQAASVSSSQQQQQQQPLQQQPQQQSTKPVQKSQQRSNNNAAPGGQAKKKKPAQQKPQATGKQQAKPQQQQQQPVKSGRARQSNNPFAVLADE